MHKLKTSIRNTCHRSTALSRLLLLAITKKCFIFTNFFRHVHSQCDPEANEQTFLEKRANQFNYMYSCKVCKGTAVRAATLSGSNTPNSSITRYNKSAVCLLLLKNQIVKMCVNFTNFLARGTNPRIITN